MDGKPESRTVGGRAVVVVVVVVDVVLVLVEDVVEVIDVVVAPGLTAGATGVTGLDGDDAGPVPTALVAWTVNVTGLPLVSPVTVANVRPSGVVTVWPDEAVIV